MGRGSQGWWRRWPGCPPCWTPPPPWWHCTLAGLPLDGHFRWRLVSCPTRWNLYFTIQITKKLNSNVLYWAYLDPEAHTHNCWLQGQRAAHWVWTIKFGIVLNCFIFIIHFYQCIVEHPSSKTQTFSRWKNLPEGSCPTSGEPLPLDLRSWEWPKVFCEFIQSHL